MKSKFIHLPSFLVLAASASLVSSIGAAVPSQPTPGERSLAAYFKKQTAALAESCLADVKTLDEWKAKKVEYRQQLFEMLSLSPLPGRSDLKPVITGKIEHELFSVEKLHFQSMPGLYVTANLFLPKNLGKPAPAILYVCGHARVITNGVSFGNKTAYEHHGSWFARNGYVCLTIDTVQLGEIEGIHHGTYREGMWWWNARGYTSAGVEAWNSIRALDYLQSRPEVDPDRLGITGRSGGGAYSWWVAALDDRIKAAAPVAGITDLQNHVVDGTVEGHCDCMFIVNTYGWDYPLVAALVAPKPLLICNSDKDSIFPLDGVVRVHAKAARIYKLYGATNALGLLITEGPHKDTQDLQLPVFRWFNRHLKGEDPVIEMAARRFFKPQDLRVFERLPSDERASKIHETFVPAAPTPSAPKSAAEWRQQRNSWKAALAEKVFRAWPGEGIPLDLKLALSADDDNFFLRAYEFTSQSDVRLTLYLLQRSRDEKPEQVTLQVMDEKGWADWTTLLRSSFSSLTKQELDALTGSPGIRLAPGPQANRFSEIQEQLKTKGALLAWVAPRGIGPTDWAATERKKIQIRRRFMLLGQTLDSMRVWDIRRAIQAVRSIESWKELPIMLRGKNRMGVNCLYAACSEPRVNLDLWELPKSHHEGPDYLNVLRFLDIPQAAAMAAENSSVHLHQSDVEGWEFPRAVLSTLSSEKQFVLSPLSSSK